MYVHGAGIKVESGPCYFDLPKDDGQRCTGFSIKIAAPYRPLVMSCSGQNATLSGCPLWRLAAAGGEEISLGSLGQADCFVDHFKAVVDLDEADFPTPCLEAIPISQNSSHSCLASPGIPAAVPLSSMRLNSP